MVTLDDVRRIKEILLEYYEWIDVDNERSHVNEDGVFEWITCSCGGDAVRALVDNGFDVIIWPSVQYRGFIVFSIS